MNRDSPADELEAQQLRDHAHFTMRSGAPNKRQHARFSVDLDVTLVSEHNFYGGFAENLSAGGVFIATHMLKSVGEKMEFSVNLPGAEAPVRGVGEVRWVREYSERSDSSPGVGLRFIFLEPGSLEAIEAFLKDRDLLFYDDEG
jgi:uncharacterized protein (TIGR02266 family)